ncbi:hypothetical protein [Nocardia aurantia]|uniref:MafI family immunity protein n=1 Tax=Nocardia aurantia TaxID=2585199 RepID=A0A7K0DGB6_9NOCA|nr:hypothetical protein [Nocardia aurantia]MQY24860.1 hypothetical protein [Nocardia aurantia]
MDLVKLHNDSRALLERFADRLSVETLATYRTFSDVGEWGELIDNLCASLVLDRIPMTPAERDSVTALLAMFPIPPEDYTFLGDPSRVLTGLNVVDEPAVVRKSE